MKYLSAVLCVMVMAMLSYPAFGADGTISFSLGGEKGAAKAEKESDDPAAKINSVIDKVADHLNSLASKTGVAMWKLQPALEEVLWEYRLRGNLYCSFGTILFVGGFFLLPRFIKMAKESPRDSVWEVFGGVGVVVSAALSIVGIILTSAYLTDVGAPAVNLLRDIMVRGA